MSLFKPSLFLIPLLASLLAGCTEENNYYVQNNPPEYGVTILYPTAQDTVRVLMNGSSADTVIKGSFQANVPSDVFVVDCGTRMTTYDGFWATIFEGESVTMHTTEFEMPILSMDYDTSDFGGVSVRSALVEILVWTDTTGQGGGVTESASAQFHVAFVDTSH